MKSAPIILLILLGIVFSIGTAEARSDCSVGTPAYPMPQDALADPACSTIYLPEIMYTGFCLTIDRPVTLIGVENYGTIIRSNLDCAVITVDDGTSANIDVSIQDLSVQWGQVGIYSVENLRLDTVTFYANDDHGLFVPTASAETTATNVRFISQFSHIGGAAIRNMGDLTLENAFISGNVSEGISAGGGVSSAGRLTIRNTMFWNNRGPDGGGLIFWGDEATLENVIFRENRAVWPTSEGVETVGRGGGLSAQAPMTLINVTFAQNEADWGSAIHAPLYPITLNNVTIAENTTHDATSGAVHSGAIVSFVNTLVANNSGENCYDGGVGDTLHSLGHNLDSGNSCQFDHPSDLPLTDPLLAPLGGTIDHTQTYYLTAASPAIDAGTNTACPVTDQRGVMRPLDGPDADDVATCDIGAFEFDDVPTAVGMVSAETGHTPSIMLITLALTLLGLLTINYQIGSKK